MLLLFILLEPFQIIFPTPHYVLSSYLLYIVKLEHSFILEMTQKKKPEHASSHLSEMAPSLYWIFGDEKMQRVVAVDFVLRGDHLFCMVHG